MIWDLLDEGCADISDWVDADYDTAVSEVSPAGQFRFDTNNGAAGNAHATRTRVITSPPNKFVMEIKTYFDALGTKVDNDFASIFYPTSTWSIEAHFVSDGLFIYKSGGTATEVGTNIVKCNGSAAWQTWRFEVDKSGGEESATVEVFLDEVSQGTFSCNFVTGGIDGRISYSQYGLTTDDRVSHIDYIKVRKVGTIIAPRSFGTIIG